VTAGSQAIAELYKYQAKGGRKVSLGRFRMPFEIVVTLQRGVRSKASVARVGFKCDCGAAHGGR
jgi:hypothetical protein